MSSVRFLVGDVRETLKRLPSGSVQCVVTSPPYYGLRDYGVDGQIGLEQTPEAYVEDLVGVFREVRRVLRDDGTAWLNLGDSYANDLKWGGHSGSKNPGSRNGNEGFRRRRETGLKPKDRMMIPARTALALQADGWWLRDEIVWHKPRTTPFPANDRTVAAHEMVYLLTKRDRYFFDWAAIEEPSAYAGQVRQTGKGLRLHGHAKAAALTKMGKANAYGGVHADAREIVVRETRRKRSVWSVNPQPYRDAHFAVMPVDLATICVKAGSRPGDTILDPFGGADTTALAARSLGRSAILCELNPAYVRLAKRRLGEPFTIAEHLAEMADKRQRATRLLERLVA